MTEKVDVLFPFVTCCWIMKYICRVELSCLYIIVISYFSIFTDLERVDNFSIFTDIERVDNFSIFTDIERVNMQSMRVLIF